MKTRESTWGLTNLKSVKKPISSCPITKQIDLAREKIKGDKKIGTTGRGIGPCYEDKAVAEGIRFVDLIDPKNLAKR